MARNAPALRKLDLSYNRMQPAGVEQIAIGLMGDTSSLQVMMLNRCGIDHIGAGHLATMLETNSNLKKLSLQFNSIGDDGWSALAGALKNGSRLESLCLGYNGIEMKGARDIAKALCSNRFLKELDVVGNRFGDDGVGHIARMLTSNATLEILHMGNFGDIGMKAFTDCLPSMKCLKTLDLTGLRGAKADTARAFLGALERNVVLEKVSVRDAAIEAEVRDEFMSRLEYLLTLNRGGRRILTSPAVPQALWPRVLGRSSDNKDVLFFFLREKPDILIRKTVSPKRKRSDAVQALWPRILGRSLYKPEVLFSFLREKSDTLIGKTVSRKRKRSDTDLA